MERCILAKDGSIKYPIYQERYGKTNFSATPHLIGVLLPQHPRHPLAAHLVPDLHTGRASASLAYGPAHYPFLTRTRQPVPYLSVSLNLHDLAMEVVVCQLGHAHVQPLPPALQLLDHVRLGTHARLPPPTPQLASLNSNECRHSACSDDNLVIFAAQAGGAVVVAPWLGTRAAFRTLIG